MRAILRKLTGRDVPPWIQVAMKEIGVKEIRGGEHDRILEYHSTTALKATEDEVPWCSSFVNWVMDQCGYQRTHSAAARSWLRWGKEVRYFQKYAVVILKRGTHWQGHVGFAMEQLPSGQILVLGGNQSDQVCYQAYAEKDVLGYRWPSGKVVEQRWA